MMRSWISILLLMSGQCLASSSEDLMRVFGDQCLTKGALNDQALQQSQALSDIIKSIRDDKNCKGVTSAYDAYADKLGYFNGFTRAARISELEGNIQDLNTALVQEKNLGSAGDQTYIQDLQTNLSSLKLELFSARQSQDINQRAVQVEALRGVQDYARRLLGAISDSQQCLETHPNIGIQTGAELLGVVGQYTSGLVSGGLIAGASILDNLVSFFRDKKYNKELKNLDSARKSEAIGCALEAVSRTMCQARDYIALTKAKTQGTVCEACENYEGGLKILKQQLQSYSVWVQRLSAGTPALTPGQASDKSQAYQLQQKYDTLVTNIDVTISQGVADLAGSNNPTSILDNVFKDLRGFIESAASTSNTCISSSQCIKEKGVLAKSFSRDPECGPAAFLKSSGKDFECVKQSGETCEICLQRVYGSVTPTIDQLKSSSDSLKILAQQNLSVEKQKFVETDPLLALAKIDTTQVNNFTARDFLINTRAYFENRLSDPKSVLGKSGVLKQAIVDAKNRIDNALAVVSNKKAMDKDDVITVSTNLIPSNNIFFISDKLNELVQQEYAAVIKDGSKSTSAAIAEYSVQESIASLLAQYGSKISATAQAESAQAQSLQTLSSLEKIFGKSVYDAISNAKDGTTLKSVNCFRILMLPSFSDTKTKKSCEKAELAVEKNGTTYKVKFSDLASQAIEKRACGIYDFSRKEQILSRQQ